VGDVWKGQALSDAQPVDGEADEIHYRIHAVDGGELLGFGSASGNALAAAVRHFVRVQGEHPGRRIVIREYDGRA
jgi:hypothetical protein